MSSCRIERKRAHDREAQRASRAKTKAYIAHLEKTVADLTESSGDNRANYLAQHASKQAQEIDNLQGLVNKIKTLVQDASKGESTSPDDTKASRLKTEGSIADSLFGDGSIIDPFSTRDTSDSPSEEQWSPEIIRKPTSDSLATTIQKTPQPQRIISATRNLNVLGISILCEDTDDCTYFSRLNDAITAVEQTPDNLSTLSEDEDILIRAILHGWDAAERVHHFDIAWRFLRAHDEGLWYRAGQVERFAHFWQMRCTMLHKIQPKNQERRRTCSFMEPTQEQLSWKGRPAIVDYFGWPAVRNHLLAQGIGKCPGRSSIAFAESFRFVWPFELRDVYKVNRATGMYSFSEGFLKSWNELSSFRMLHNSLIPYYCHPSLAQAAPVPKFEQGFEQGSDSDESVDEEVLRCTASATSVETSNLEAMMQDDNVGEWMHQVVDMTDEARQFVLDPFSMAHETGISQWP